MTHRQSGHPHNARRRGFVARPWISPPVRPTRVPVPGGFPVTTTTATVPSLAPCPMEAQELVLDLASVSSISSVSSPKSPPPIASDYQLFEAW